jgi:glycosyltransferase involved in cell wall biosynthesis
MRFSRLNNLALVFSRGTTLLTWHSTGVIDRELAYLCELKKYVKNIYIFTYDNVDYSSDLKSIIDKFQSNGIIPICMGKTLGSTFITSLIFPFKFYKLYSHIDVWRSQQADGAWTAMFFAKLNNKFFHFRQGYRWTTFLRIRRKTIKMTLALIAERLLFQFANLSTITSETDVDEFNSSLIVSRKKMKHLPNWAFEGELIYRKSSNRKKNFRSCFVGRITPEKRINDIIDIVAKIKCIDLDIFGPVVEGEIFDKNSLPVNIKYRGVIPNAALQKELENFDYIFLLSKMEGHPKALIEAMSKGVVPICDTTPGIKTIIFHEKNGILIQGSSNTKIAENLLNSIRNNNFSYLSKGAQESVRNLSLSEVASLEMQFILD